MNYNYGINPSIWAPKYSTFSLVNNAGHNIIVDTTHYWYIKHDSV